MRVFKFGGTSVGNAKRFSAVAEIVRQAPADDLVVVSAMCGVTSALIDGARAAAEGDTAPYRAVRAGLHERHLGVITELLADSDERRELIAAIDESLGTYARLCESIALLGELTARGSDAVAALGEGLSSRILAALLRARGRRAVAVNATTCVRTDSHFGEALPDLEETHLLACREVLPLLQEGITPVVTGYIASDARGATTTLGRGGSDYSAAILGVALDAEEVWIWTDVDGILTADPRLVPEARTLEQLSYAEAEELAYFGASVLHPKTVAPLAARGVPLRIVNSFAPHRPGTLIVAEPDPCRRRLPAIITTQGLSLLGVEGDGATWSLQHATRALGRLAERGMPVLMFSQSFSERNLNLVVWARDQAHALRALEGEFANELALGQVARIGLREEVATLSVVGMPDAAGEPITPRAYAALGALGTPVISVGQASSAYSVSFVIPEREVARAVPFIHRELGL